jgi:hypothetical protein
MPWILHKKTIFFTIYFRPFFQVSFYLGHICYVPSQSINEERHSDAIDKMSSGLRV